MEKEEERKEGEKEYETFFGLGKITFSALREKHTLLDKRGKFSRAVFFHNTYLMFLARRFRDDSQNVSGREREVGWQEEVAIKTQDF